MSSQIDVHEPLLNDVSKNGFKSGVRRSKSTPAADYSLNQTKPVSSPQPGPKLTLTVLTAPRALTILIIYLAVGVLCFLYFIDDFHGKKTVYFVDALYFCVVTMTTVGYGDLVPSTVPAKLFSCVFVFVGFGLIGLIVGHGANYLVEKQQRILEKAFEHHRHPPSEARIMHVHHKVAVAAGLVVIILGVGIGILMAIEGLSFVDALYCVCVTVTTLGYGDNGFSTSRGRIAAVFWILASTASVAQFMLYLAEMITEERQHALAQWALTRKVTVSDLEAADIDNDGVLGAPEFVIYKLKELGKIDDEDVKAILEEFRECDVDQSGAITISDISKQGASS